jgi:hypothetical protein
MKRLSLLAVAIGIAVAILAPTASASTAPLQSLAGRWTGTLDGVKPKIVVTIDLTGYFTPQSTQQIDYGVPGLQAMIDAGWVVCATDYRGLGSPGVHQYTVGVTNGRDSVFISRAARHLDAAPRRADIDVARRLPAPYTTAITCRPNLPVRL